MSELLVSERAAAVGPAVTSNGRSNFVFVWGKESGQLVAALFDSSGQPETGELFVSAGAGRAPVATHLAGARRGFGVAWLEDDPPRVMFRRFTPDGDPHEEPLQVSAGRSVPGFPPAVARGSDGNAIVCWVGEDGAIHAVTFDLDGLPRPEIKVSPAEGQHGGPVRVVALENNTFAVCWIGGPSPLRAAMLQVLQPNGTPVQPPRALDLSNLGSNFAIAPIVGGTAPATNFALAHVASPLLAGERMVVCTLFGPSGDRLGGGSFNITHRDDRSVASNLAVVAQPGRRFLVVWSDRPAPEVPSAKGETVRSRPCSEDNGTLGSALQVSEAVSGNQNLPAAAFLFDPEIGVGATAVAWIDDTHNAGASVQAVKARII